MVFVKYVGTRSCKADGVQWSKYEIKDVTQDFYDRFKNQGFELVDKEEKKKKIVIKRPVIIEEEPVEDIIDDVDDDDIEEDFD